jgi:hypothetical protein
MKTRLAIALILVLGMAGVGTVLAQKGATVNPTVGSVWTYFGPTFGADWAVPSQPPTVLNYGATCNGFGDDGPALNAAAAATHVLLVPAGSNCRIVTPVVLTKFPFELHGQDAWPTTGSGIVPGVLASQITCATAGTADCIRTATTTAQKPGILIEGIVFDGSAMTGGNILGLYNPTKTSLKHVTMNKVWNGIRLEGPNDNTTVIDQLMIQECRGEQAVLWTNASMSNFSVVLTITNSNIACLSATDGIVLDGNIQTLRIQTTSIIDSGKELWMRNTVGSTVCPGYVFADTIEFNGGPNTENFIKADCGYSVQIVNGWSYGATSGDGFAFNKHTAPSTTGSNQLHIDNSSLLGNMVGGRCMFLDWNHISISNTMISGCTGNVLESGANTQRTIVSGGLIGGPSSGYCVASTAAGPLRSLFLSGTMVFGGCTLGNFNDPGQAIVLTGVIGGPPLGAMTAIGGCGSGCTVAIYTGNQAIGSIKMTSGTAPASSGQFTMNFTVPLTPAPLCIAMPRVGGSGVWNSLAAIQMEPTGSTGLSSILHWWNNSVALTAGQDYYIDFRCAGLS